MSFEQSRSTASKPGHLGHLLATCPQRVDIWAIWATCQPATTHCPLSFVNCPCIAPATAPVLCHQLPTLPPSP